MADRADLLTWGGLGLLAFGGLLWLQQSKPAGGPAPRPGPTGPTSCARQGRASIVVDSWFYNWSDLRKLPLGGEAYSWSTGGPTAALGWAKGTSVYWSEAKQGVASDGRSGWFVRVVGANGPGQGGDWALPAADLGVGNPCA